MTQTQTFQAGQKVRIIDSTWGSSADAKRVHIGLEVEIHRYDSSDNSYSAQIDGWGVWFNPSDLQLVTAPQENTMTNTAALDIPSYLIKLDQVIAAHPAVGLAGTDTVTLDFLYSEYNACKEGRDGVISDFRRHLNITLTDDAPFDILSGIRSMSDSSASWMLAAHRSWRTRALQLAALDALSVVCLAYPPAEPEAVRAFITEGYTVITASTDADFVHADDAHRAADTYYYRDNGLDERVGSAATAIFHAHTRLLGPENLARYLAGKSGQTLSVTTPIMREIIAQALEKRLSASGVADVTTPIKFEDAARVRVMRSTNTESYGCHNAGNRRMIGTVGIISGIPVDGAYRVYLEDRSDWFRFNHTDLELAVEEVAAEPTRPAFQVGDLVRVLGSSYSGLYGCSSSGSHRMVGTVGEVRTDHDDHWAVNTPDGCDFFYFTTSDLELVTMEMVLEDVTAPVATTASDIITFEGEEFTRQNVDGKVILTPYVAPPAREPKQGEVWQRVAPDSARGIYHVIQIQGRGLIFASLAAGNCWDSSRLSYVPGEFEFLAESVVAAAAAGLLV